MWPALSEVPLSTSLLKTSMVTRSRPHSTHSGHWRSCHRVSRYRDLSTGRSWSGGWEKRSLTLHLSGALQMGARRKTIHFERNVDPAITGDGSRYRHDRSTVESRDSNRRSLLWMRLRSHCLSAFPGWFCLSVAGDGRPHRGLSRHAPAPVVGAAHPCGRSQRCRHHCV